MIGSQAALIRPHPALDSRIAAARPTMTAYRATRLDTADAIIAALAEFDAAETPFQTPHWLRAVYDELAPAHGAGPLAVRVTEAESGRLALLLPLIVTRDGGTTIAGFPDFGVSDYGAPLLGPAAPTEASDGVRMWTAIAAALDGIDLVRLSSMPTLLGGRPNPLLAAGHEMPSRHAANRLAIETSLEDFLRSRGKKYRKEVERCYRLLDKEGAWSFRRAETPHEVARAYATLETQQGARRHAAGGEYALDKPEYSHVYERVLRDGVAEGSAHIFTLETERDTVAVLLGLTHAGAFTLLRISNGGERWHHLSPGRLVVAEAMRHFLAHGIRTFDMGIGDYAFKRGFGIEPDPLVDLVAGLTWRGKAHATLIHAKNRARQSSRLMALADRLRGKR
ncbi:MAG: GNAT family N-acetyltransferase [Hyphomicrobium sp.]